MCDVEDVRHLLARKHVVAGLVGRQRHPAEEHVAGRVPVLARHEDAVHLRFDDQAVDGHLRARSAAIFDLVRFSVATASMARLVSVWDFDPASICASLRRASSSEI